MSSGGGRYTLGADPEFGGDDGDGSASELIGKPPRRSRCRHSSDSCRGGTYRSRRAAKLAGDVGHRTPGVDLCAHRSLGPDRSGLERDVSKRVSPCDPGRACSRGLLKAPPAATPRCRYASLSATSTTSFGVDVLARLGIGGGEPGPGGLTERRGQLPFSRHRRADVLRGGRCSVSRATSMPPRPVRVVVSGLAVPDSRMVVVSVGISADERRDERSHLGHRRRGGT